MKNRTGIWLDSDNAYIVRLLEDGPKVKTIVSDVEHFNVHGGYGGADRSLGQDARGDEKLENRKKHQLQRYFDVVIGALPVSGALVIMGPGETKTGLQKALMARKDLDKIEIRTVEPADKMTENQLVAAVKDAFGKDWRKPV